MSELQGYRDIVLTYSSTSGNFTVGTSSIIYVFSEGASLNGAQTITAAAGQVITVYDVGSFTGATMFAQIGVAGPIRRVTAVGATTLTLDAGTGGTFATNTRVLNVGTASDRSVSGATIYPVDQSTATASTQPISADTNGNFQFFAATGDYDILIRNAGNTADQYIIADITLAAFIRSSSAGLVSLQSATDDFAVGGTTLGSGTPAFFVDESAEKLYLRGNSGLFAALDGALATLTLATTSGEPKIIWQDIAGSGSQMTLTTAVLTSAKTITLPDLTTTLAGLAGTQTFTGAKTFTGGVTLSTTAVSVTSAVQSTSTGYFQTGLNVGTTDTPSGGDLTAKRLRSIRGSAFPGGSIVPTAGATPFGTGPTVAVDTNSTDQRFSFTITVGTTPSGTAGTITITPFADGTWTTAPFISIQRNGGTAPSAATGDKALTWTITATTLTISYTFLSAPTAGNTITFSVFVWG